MKSFTTFSVYCIDLVHELNIIFGRFVVLFCLNNDPQSKAHSENIYCTSEKKNSSKTEINFLNLDNRTTSKGKIDFKEYFAYSKENSSSPFLSNINCSFSQGRLYGVTGKISSGKSIFLAAILGELPYYSGSLSVKGSLAYV